MQKCADLNIKAFFKWRILPEIIGDWAFKRAVAVALQHEDILLVAFAFPFAANG